MTKFAIIGLGLIGGSLALAVREAVSSSVVYGFDTCSDNLRWSIKSGMIDRELLTQDYNHIDVLIVAIPVDGAIPCLIEVLNRINPAALVLDVGSVKMPICQAVAAHPKRNQFLAAHPIAGTEFSGPQAAVVGLFKGKTIIICESGKTDKTRLSWAKKWFDKMQMNIEEMTPEAHDAQLAFVSHLSHVLSFALGQTALHQKKLSIAALAGSGFASTVRLAKSSPDIWLPIFRLNKSNLLEALEQLIHNLEEFRNMLQHEQYTRLYNTICLINTIGARLIDKSKK